MCVCVCVDYVHIKTRMRAQTQTRTCTNSYLCREGGTRVTCYPRETKSTGIEPHPTKVSPTSSPCTPPQNDTLLSRGLSSFSSRVAPVAPQSRTTVLNTDDLYRCNEHEAEYIRGTHRSKAPMRVPMPSYYRYG